MISNQKQLFASKLGVSERCSYINGDMFSNGEIPSADAYIMKMILHDWSDEECVSILSNVYRSSPNHAKLFIAEYLVPDPDELHFSKLFDKHMKCVAVGQSVNIPVCCNNQVGSTFKPCIPTSDRD